MTTKDCTRFTFRCLFISSLKSNSITVTDIRTISIYQFLSGSGSYQLISGSPRQDGQSKDKKTDPDRVDSQSTDSS